MPMAIADFLIPIEPGQAVSRGWTQATGGRPVGVTWHWTATQDLDTCTRVLGGRNAERRGAASAHYGVGRSRAEGVHRYVSLEDRSWHAGINQTVRWDGKSLSSGAFKGSRTTIGIETVHMGYARPGNEAAPGWACAAAPNGRHIMMIPPWPEEQIGLMIEVGKEVVHRWPHIGFRDHHGHHDLCPGYKQDVAAFPFARVLRGIYDDATIPDVWTPTWRPEQRQRVLIALGYDLGSTGADGDWGRRSDAALRAFQADHSMPADGMWTTFTSWQVHDALRGEGLDLATVADTHP